MKALKPSRVWQQVEVAPLALEHYDGDWWKRVFDEIYLLTDARSVCSPEVTSAEVDMVLAILGLHPDDSILDLCGGQGRHAIELCRRGYCRVTVVDYSEVLLRLGTAAAKRAGSPVSFCRADARQVGLRAGAFDVVLIMGNSFGYFADDDQNRRILMEVCRLLKPGGRLLLDLADGDYVRQQLSSGSWHEANGDVVVCRQRRLCSGGVVVREMVLSKQRGLVRDVSYFARLFQPAELQTLLDASGFKQITFGRGPTRLPEAGDYGLLGRRLLVTAEKAVDT